jgi:C1A family cysteine protease
MKVIYAIGMLTVILTLSFAPSTVQAAGDKVLFWLDLNDRADLATLRTEILDLGGRIVTLAPENALLVEVDSMQRDTLNSLEGVDNTRLCPTLDKSKTTRAVRSAPPILSDGLRDANDEETSRITPLLETDITIEANELSKDRAFAQKGDRDSLPSQVDNSVSEYFPPIGSQGSLGSCASWASGYYMATYIQAMDNNTDVSSEGLKAICSPGFLYPLVNMGEDHGSSLLYNLTILCDVGCASWATKPYDGSDFTTWPTEAAWLEALYARMDEVHIVSATSGGCSDENFANIKQLLANGTVAVTSTGVYPNWYNNYPNDADGIDNGVLYDISGEKLGGHAMTIVGYDDSKVYHTGSSTEYGAFLIANSWGADWGTSNTVNTERGFMWVAYDFFKADNGCFGYAAYTSDRVDYRPRMYAATGMTHPSRGVVRYRGGIGVTDDPDWESNPCIAYDGGTSIGLTPENRIVVDLTDALTSSPVTGESYPVYVQMHLHPVATSSGTINTVDFYYDEDNSGVFKIVESDDPVVTVTKGDSAYATADVTLVKVISAVGDVWNAYR